VEWPLPLGEEGEKQGVDVPEKKKTTRKLQHEQE
jgi:hypothetical protein